jgi:CubicO group peptidase (beta-lactamase class C family)
MRVVPVIAIICLVTGICPARQSRAQTVDALLNNLHQEDDFNGYVLIAEKGKTIYAKSFGFANVENKTPITENTIFLIGSVSKTFTATAILKLKEQGKLSLNDNIENYFPELPYKNMTIRHLLTHTSGLLEYQSDEVIKEIRDKGVTNAELVKVLARLKPKEAFQPGSKWEYSNMNYILLALIVEKVSGETFPQFVKQNIFLPAHMDHTFVLISNLPDSLKSDLASGYRFTSLLSTSAVNVESMPGARRAYATKKNLYGPGNVYSTAKDLLKYHEALQAGKILRRQTLLEMYTPIRLSSGEDYSTFSRTNYLSKNALGWFVANDNSAGTVVYHPGGDIGFVSYFMRNITRDQTVIILANNEVIRHSTATSLMRILNHQPYKLDTKSLARALGKQYSSHGIDATLRLFDRLKDNKGYSYSEEEINDLGYQLMIEKSDIKAAIELFKINAERFPRSFNVWDSLGEAYYKKGDKETALQYYEKSLSLNPENEEGKNMLKKIKGELGRP